MRILLLEDHCATGTALMRGLRQAGYAIDWIRDGESAMTAMADQRSGYGLALLKWESPKRAGLSILSWLRERGDDIPVILSTEDAQVGDRITGLDKGADDIIQTTIETPELLARIRRVLRRCAGRVDNRLIHGELTLDPITNTVDRSGTAVDITPLEFSLLRALMERPGTVLSRDQLERQLYSWDDPVESNVIDVLINRLRRKLGAELIQNKRNIGWHVRSVQAA